MIDITLTKIVVPPSDSTETTKIMRNPELEAKTAAVEKEI